MDWEIAEKKNRTRFELLQGATVQECALIHHTFFTIRNVSLSAKPFSVAVWKRHKRVPSSFFQPDDTSHRPVLFKDTQHRPPAESSHEWRFEMRKTFCEGSSKFSLVRSFPLVTLKSELKAFFFILTGFILVTVCLWALFSLFSPFTQISPF